jgi:hypothetical protein
MRQYGYYANNVFGPRYYSFDCMAAGKHLTSLIMVGYLVCFFALMVFGFYHRAAKQRVSAYVNFFLATLSIVDLFIIPYSVFAVATS